MKYAEIEGGVVTGVVNWNGSDKHPYGKQVDLRGPLLDSVGLELVGKTAADIDATIAAAKKPAVAEESKSVLKAEPKGSFMAPASNPEPTKAQAKRA